jgi:antitoxin (DNA-binding transcriptional repressor) of toxin-antitoxin stability system
MRSVRISVTEASRNFADCINRARYQGTSFILHKNGVTVARIVPERRQAAQPDSGPEPAPDEKDRTPEEEGAITPKQIGSRTIW